jgi:predicted acyltransferase
MNRLLSLDVFRGITIASMILVNNPGSWTAIYAPLKHAEWHGCTPTDLVFPFFLWISGRAMTLSFSRRKEQGADRGRLLLHTTRRAATIFLLGLLLNLIPNFDFAHVRIPGVLQRIGICYFFATAIYLYTSRAGQIASAALLLLAYTATMLYLPFPGASPDRWSMDANAARYIDGLVLEGHMWRQTRVWDPEGVLSTVPAIATMLCGILAASYIRSGAMLAVAGLALSFAIPINKALWTPSFVLLTAGLASLLFGFLHWWIDERGNRRGWRFFEIYGTNAIVSFVVSGALARILALTQVDGMATSRWIYTQLLLPWLNAWNASLAYALANVFVMFLLVAWLHRRKILVRL